MIARIAQHARSLAAVAAAAVCCAAASAQLNRVPREAEGVGVTERLGEQVPLDLIFTNASGQTVPLRKYFDGEKPVLLALVYYDCPMICMMVMDRMTEAMNEIDFTVGHDYNAVVVSFRTAETTTHAAAAKAAMLAGYDNHDIDSKVREGYAFHTADYQNVKALADAVGFRYNALDNGEYAHPSVIFALTPDGVVSRYIHGLEYPPRDIKLSLMDAAEGKLTRSLGDAAIGFCFQWDPNTGAYTLQAFRVMQLAGYLTMLIVGAWLAIMFWRDRARRRRDRAVRGRDERGKLTGRGSSTTNAHSGADVDGAAPVPSNSGLAGAGTGA